MKKLQAALEAFLESSDFPEGVVKSTKAGWGGSGYSVELFEDGSHRVLWDNEIGNLYESPGIILGLSALDDSDYQDLVSNGDMSEEDFFFEAFFNEQDEIADGLRESLAACIKSAEEAERMREEMWKEFEAEGKVYG